MLQNKSQKNPISDLNQLHLIKKTESSNEKNGSKNKYSPKLDDFQERKNIRMQKAIILNLFIF